MSISERKLTLRVHKRQTQILQPPGVTSAVAFHIQCKTWHGYPLRSHVLTHWRTSHGCGPI